MKKAIYSITVICLLLTLTAQAFSPERQLRYCHAQVCKALRLMQPCDFSRMPRNILNGETRWNCKEACAEEWCSGFWPGILWMDYQSSKDPAIRQAAENYTQALEFLPHQPAYDHDLGFIVINSFMKGFELTHNPLYRNLALEAADSLATLFNPKAGTILSWPRHVKDYGGHNTIMDNMMNLELLFWAAENGGNTALRNIAVRHAETTMNHHFRPDGSSYHVAVYDSLTGQFMRGLTHQGYADWSMWARGQAWAVYGFTMVYRFTNDQRFLLFAQKVADVYIKRLLDTSNDWIPIWDMDDPRGINAPKDASAACIVADALIELDTYAPGKNYKKMAVRMLKDLSSKRYQSRNKNTAFLLHSTGHHPAGSEIDASIVYADYYYIEALLRLISKN